MLDACAGRDVRLVYASSSSVYGNATELPVTEAAPLIPMSPYGATKVMTETLAGAYAASYGLAAVGLRYFSVYGPRQRPDMGIERFIEAGLAGRPIHVFGDGRQLRDFTYVGDVVRGTIAALEAAARLGLQHRVRPAGGAARRARPARAGDRAAARRPARDGRGRRRARHARVDRAWPRPSSASPPRPTLRDGLAAQIAEHAGRRAA